MDFLADEKVADKPATPAPTENDKGGPLPLEPWKVAVVDDEEDIHLLTGAVLRGFMFDGRPLKLFYGYSGKDAERLLRTHPDTAVLLLDVVMETDRAGLDAVRTIREALGNRFVRIILRTGQAGQAPEKEVIANYDINDYREKSDMTSRRLVTSITAGLRAYRDMRTIEWLAQSNEVLERRVKERTWALMESNRQLLQEIGVRRQTEDALRKSRELLDHAQELTHLGSWEWDIPGNTLFWSEEMCRILGIAGCQAVSPECLRTAIHPADQGRMDAALAEAMNTNRPFSLEHRIVRANGEERVVRAVGELLRNSAGKPFRIVGTMHDITEQRQTEEQLQIAARIFNDALAEAEGQLKITTMAFENAMEGVMVTDPHGVILSVNPAFTAITGYSPAEAVGRTASFLRSNRHDKFFYQALWAELLAHGQWRGEIWNRRANGEPYPEWLTITSIWDKQGAPTHYVGVFHDLTAIKRSEEELHFKTYHDTLTGLPNRELFRDRLQQAITHTHRSPERMAVAMLNLDLFRNVNNSLGHPSGDRLLQACSRRFLEFLREGDTISRMAGDSFAFIIRDTEEVQDVLNVAQKLLNVLALPFLIDSQQIFITASMGITLYPNDGTQADTLIKNADIALNRAKKAGRSNYQFYTPTMGEQAERRLAIERDMRMAIEQEEFVLHYQPKVDIPQGKVTGMEALVRWRRTDGAMISPAEFIPLAEESGLIIPLGYWILRTACQQSLAWFKKNSTLRRISVNLSPVQFRQKDLVQKIGAILADVGMEPALLDLEITEGMVMADVESAIITLRDLRAMGLHISIDDFGTGYSSLNYLKRFPINCLKIDQSFVRELPTDADNAVIVAAIISLARSLGLTVVAEGVETEEHLAFLRQHQCDEFQGYLFSRPLPAEAFQQLLEQQG